MKFAIWDHAGKGQHLKQALLDAGHQSAPTLEDLDLLLVDCDWRWAHPRPELIREAKNAGAKVATFPHGGLPTVFVYDGLTEPDPNVDLRLEHGAGSVDVAERLVLELKQAAPGWLYSDTAPFKPAKDPKRFLFAPQHPNMETIGLPTNGHDPGPALNQHVYKQLLKLGYELTVSLVGPPWLNGVWPHPRARIVANPGMSYQASLQLIQGADVVVGAGTMAATAIALGKPTVMLGQGNYADFVDGEYRLPDHIDVYADALRYPLDGEYGDLEELVHAACAGDEAAADWRARFVGEAGAERAVGLLEDLVGTTESEQLNARIEGVTARARMMNL